MTDRYTAIHRTGLCWTLLLLLFLFPTQVELGANGSSEENSEDTIVLREIRTDIDGKTRRGALLNELRLQEGREYENAEALEDMLNKRAKDLKSRRLFKEFSWSISYPEDGYAEIDIHIVDSPTFLPRPMVKYASDTGLLLGLNVEYFNSFGSLTDQAFVFYWSPKEMRINIDVKNIAIGPLHLDLNVEQFDGDTLFGDPEGNVVVEYRNASSSFSFLADLQLGRSSPWSYIIEPHFLWQYGYRSEFDGSGQIVVTPDFTLGADYVIIPGFAPGIDHGVVSNQISWLGNFRKGWQFSLMNTNTWYVESTRNDIIVESEFLGFLPVLQWLELSTRIGGFYAFEGTREEAGEKFRGVLDYNSYGYAGFYMTAQMNFQLVPSGSLIELQFRPFTDFGYVASHVWGTGPEAWEYCAGATFIMFLRPLPSMVLNIEYGWDFKRNSPEVIVDTQLSF